MYTQALRMYTVSIKNVHTHNVYKKEKKQGDKHTHARKIMKNVST